MTADRCPCDRALAAVGIHDAVACPIGRSECAGLHAVTAVPGPDDAQSRWYLDAAARLSAVQADLDAARDAQRRNTSDYNSLYSGMGQVKAELVRAQAAHEVTCRLAGQENRRLRAERDEAREDAIAYRNRADELHAERDTALTEVIALRADRDEAWRNALDMREQLEAAQETLQAVGEAVTTAGSAREAQLLVLAVLAGDSTDGNTA